MMLMVLSPIEAMDLFLALFYFLFLQQNYLLCGDRPP